MTDLKVGQYVAFAGTGVRCGTVLKTGISGCGGRKLVKIHGINGAQGWTVSEECAVRIPGPDEVIISKEELEELREDSRFLSRLQNAGVDNWDGYEFACEEEDEEDRD